MRRPLIVSRPMNTSAYLLLAASLCFLAGGCATDDLTLRVIEIRATQNEAATSGHAGLSASVATNVFHDVAGRLGPLGYVNSPHHHNPDPANPAWVEYAVSFTPPGASSVDLTMDLDGKHVTFHGETDDDPPSVTALEKAMTLCRQALDERRIKYRVHTFTTRLVMEKASSAR